jgi:signal transduction histidine kinase
VIPPSRQPREAAPCVPDKAGEGIMAVLARMEHDLEGSAAREAPKLRKAIAELRALFGQLGEGSRDLASFSEFLQMQNERERASLARELHDTLGGILTPAKMDISWLVSRLGQDPDCGARINRVDALIDQGIDLKRRIIEDLHPSLLDHLGLASALRWLVDGVCKDTGLDCNLTISPVLERLPSDTEIALYRVVQEGVENIVKHARSRRLDLAIERNAQGLNVVVADDGIGIADLDAAKKRAHGIAGMIHRVHSVNGSITIHSRPGHGTRIEAFVPLPPAK